jgi:predicted MPP superfamily phosphohydrolase
MTREQDGDGPTVPARSAQEPQQQQAPGEPKVTRRGGFPRPWLWALGAGLVAIVAVLALRGIVDTEFQAAWIADRDRRTVRFQLWIYWGCWLLWPLLAWAAWRIRQAWRRGKADRRARALPGWSAALLVFCACGVWARFIEPSLLLVRETRLSSTCGLRVALVSDLHLGTFGRTHDLDHLVDRLNTLKVDAVLVAGDWTVEPAHDLGRILAPLSRLRHRTLSVTGNHDEEAPGPPLTEDLRRALASLGVVNMEARRLPLGRCEFVGLGDLSSGATTEHLASLARRPSDVPGGRRVVLAHDPDTALELPDGYAAWVLAGHTHGGQMRLPFLTARLLHSMTRGHFTQGLHELPHTRVFVTSGTGTSNLPFRFGVPPVIDVLGL